MAREPSERRPLVIAHRGASGHRPEHTLEAYALAIEMGADVIEPDLVPTKDGHLIARHDRELERTTDVADRFPDREGRWVSEAFTLAEIQTLRARERTATRSHAFDGQYAIPTFEEVVELALRLGHSRGRPVGLYPETKHPSYFRRIGLPIEEPLLSTLGRHGLNTRDAPVFIQSFEADNLRALRRTTTVRLTQLVDDPEKVTDAGLSAIAAYADGIGPNKNLVVGTDLVARAHRAGLFVHAWTLLADAEIRQVRSLGVDGIFTDFPDVAVAVFAAGDGERIILTP